MITRHQKINSMKEGNPVFFLDVLVVRRGGNFFYYQDAKFVTSQDVVLGEEKFNV